MELATKDGRLLGAVYGTVGARRHIVASVETHGVKVFRSRVLFTSVATTMYDR